MQIHPDVLASHSDLSTTSVDFLRFAQENPGCLERSRFDHADLPQWLAALAAGAQRWPVFADAAKIDEIRRATLGLAALVKQIPHRFLGGDPERISELYGIISKADVAVLLDPPTGLDAALARCDFVESRDGLQCLEVNAGAALGGWQVSALEDFFRADPELARFFTDQGVEPRHHNPVRTLFAHVLSSILRAGIARDEVCILFLISEVSEAEAGRAAYFRTVLDGVCRELDSDLSAEVAFHGHDQGRLDVRDGAIFHRGRQVHAVLEYAQEETPIEVFRAFKGGHLILFNSPLMRLLGSKATLALLSELEESDGLTEEEREVIRRYVPWSRRVLPGEVSFEGETADLLDLLVRRRERFVIKPCGGRGGEGVHVGRSTDPEVWDELVRSAPHGPPQLAQQYVESRPYLFQAGEEGAAPHEMNWGTFCFGDTWAGAFLRTMPMGEKARIVNVSQGARRTLLFEV